MARSIIFPRTTDNESFFCAELVAAVMKRGGLMSTTSNPGAATPESLYQIYKSKAAVHANPFVLRSFSAIPKAVPAVARSTEIGFSGILVPSQPERRSLSQSHQRRLRTDSPPRAAFRPVLGSGALATDNLALLKR